VRRSPPLPLWRSHVEVVMTHLVRATKVGPFATGDYDHSELGLGAHLALRNYNNDIRNGD